MKNLSGAASLAASILVAASPGASAQAPADYVFNVPVKVSGLGSGRRAEVQCTTSSDQGGAKGGSRQLNVGSSPVPLDPSGNFSGTVTVRVVYAPVGNPPLVATNYVCYLVIDSGATRPPAKSATWESRGKL